MKPRIAVAGLFLLVGPSTALAQEVTPRRPPASITTATSSGWQSSRGEAVPGLDALSRGGGVETERFSAVLQAMDSVKEMTVRGAKESQVYSVASPSVVLVVTKDSLGSGSLLSATGDILTNYHVVEGTKQVGVVFKPRLEGVEPTEKDIIVGQVVRVDPTRDLALIRVPKVPAGRTPIEVGSLQDVQVGADVHAIGHPTGETWTYTKGLVSQIRRGYEWTAGEADRQHKADVIQTQTPINPGNSGGPLLTDNGRLVGVNTFGKEGEGLNYAVSADDVRKFMAGQIAKAPAPARRAEAAAPAKGCQVRTGKRTFDKDWGSWLTPVDATCDGRVDFLIEEPRDASKPIGLWVDDNNNDEFEAAYFDDRRDRKWDWSLHDTDEDGKWDLVGYHDTGELEPTRYAKYRK